jgi:hypothetical protein
MKTATQKNEDFTKDLKTRDDFLQKVYATKDNLKFSARMKS